MLCCQKILWFLVFVMGSAWFGTPIFHVTGFLIFAAGAASEVFADLLALVVMGHDLDISTKGIFCIKMV